MEQWVEHCKWCKHRKTTLERFKRWIAAGRDESLRDEPSYLNFIRLDYHHAFGQEFPLFGTLGRPKGMVDFDPSWEGNTDVCERVIPSLRTKIEKIGPTEAYVPAAKFRAICDRAVQGLEDKQHRSNSEEQVFRAATMLLSNANRVTWERVQRQIEFNLKACSPAKPEQEAYRGYGSGDATQREYRHKGEKGKGKGEKGKGEKGKGKGKAGAKTPKNFCYLLGSR